MTTKFSLFQLFLFMSFGQYDSKQTVFLFLQRANQIDMSAQSELMAAFEETL